MENEFSISGTQALGATVPADIAQHKMKDPVDFSRKKLKSGKKKKELKVLRMYVVSSITISAICVPYTLRGQDKELGEEKIEKVGEEAPVPPDEDDLVDMAITVSRFLFTFCIHVCMYVSIMHARTVL